MNAQMPMHAQMSENNINVFVNGNRLNGDSRHYYNARYPPRRGRYGRNINSGYYRQKNVVSNNNLSIHTIH